jgi:Zn-dependent oligopeptidase
MRNGAIFGVIMAGLMTAGAADAATAPKASATAAAPNADSAQADAFAAVLHLTPKTPAEVTANCDAYLARGARMLAELEGETGTASVETTFRRFDALYSVINAGSNDVRLVSETNPDKDIRSAAEACVQKLSDLITKVSLSRGVYDRLSAIDTSAADPKIAFLVKRTLDSYRRAGVDRDAATRAKVTKLQEEITAIGLEFDRNIREGRQEITVASAAELDGLPADFIAQHKPGPDGVIRLTTEYPDFVPVMTYAKNEDLRRRMLFVYESRAHPQNDAVLKRLLAKRYELAVTLGFKSYADLITSDKMIGSPQRAYAFLDDIAGAAKVASERDYGKLLARLKQIDPKATEVPRWNSAYLNQLVRKEQFDVDPQVVRQYFAYDNVKDGIIKLTEDLFGVDIRPWNTQVWDPSVQPYEMYQDGRLIGRFYLDMHPRDGKYNHAAQFPVRAGVKDRQVPVGVLLCNFPAGDHATGLMEHGDVETFLHEFGHLLHWMFSGQQDYSLQNFGEIEWDFVEAPSQLLENWVWDYDTLKGFAVNAKGETIPQPLVAKMRTARDFGTALGARTQLAYSAISLAYHDRPADQVDLTGLWEQQYEKYAAYHYLPGTYPYDAFGHLNGYSSIYYTYVWSKAISLDLFSVFKKDGLRNPETARRYREQVLAPGSSAPARVLLQDFLGRPMSVEAYKQWLQTGG